LEMPASCPVKAVHKRTGDDSTPDSAGQDHGEACLFLPLSPDRLVTADGQLVGLLRMPQLC
jgi:hypothetical protein